MLRDEAGLTWAAVTVGPDMLRDPLGPRIANRCDLKIWLDISGDANRMLLRELKPIAVMEQFMVLDVAKVDRDDRSICCSLMFVGRGPDAERHILSLLRRISAKHRWLSVERCGVLSAPANDDREELDWDEFGRRMMP